MFLVILLDELTRSTERLQAIPSEWAEWVLRLDRTYVTIENGLVDYIDVATTRARTFYNIAIFVFCCYQLPARPHPTASALEKFLRDAPNPEPDFKRKIDYALQMFLQIASDEKYGHIAFKEINKKVAPVEFVFIGTLRIFYVNLLLSYATQYMMFSIIYVSGEILTTHKESCSTSLAATIMTTRPAQTI